MCGGSLPAAGVMGHSTCCASQRVRPPVVVAEAFSASKANDVHSSSGTVLAQACVWVCPHVSVNVWVCECPCARHTDISDVASRRDRIQQNRAT